LSPIALAPPLMTPLPTEDRIMALQNIRRRGAAVAAVAGLGALLVGCSNGLPNAQVQAGSAAGAPMSIACEPNQRAVVRQVVVNGVMQAQAECTSVGAVGTTGVVAYAPAAAAAQPVSYVPAPYGYTPEAIPQTRLVQPVYTQPLARREAAPRASYQPSRERMVYARPKRSVKKSAVIIGSSAGVGAGVGALIGGKKGAGIGALVGGGGAALWDQITRRK
jgi:hypothetical protein